MPKGSKIITISDGTDVIYVCEVCGKKFYGSEKSIDIRFRLHCKKVHNEISKKIDWGIHKAIRSNDQSLLTNNKNEYSYWN